MQDVRLTGRLLCECFDGECAGNHDMRALDGCGKRASVTLYRVDAHDESGTLFCDECADDAMDSGLFTDRDDESEA